MNVEIGDIVQIDPASNKTFAACLLIVTEVKSWGVQGYVSIPQADGPGLAFYRCKNEDFVKVGSAEWIRGEDTE